MSTTKPYRLHILVCCDSDCTEKGSQQIYDTLKNILKEQNLRDRVKVSKSTCLDDCESGPNLLVYPQGIVYNAVSPETAKKILNAHLKGKKVHDLRHHKMVEQHQACYDQT